MQRLQQKEVMKYSQAIKNHEFRFLSHQMATNATGHFRDAVSLSVLRLRSCIIILVLHLPVYASRQNQDKSRCHGNEEDLELFRQNRKYVPTMLPNNSWGKVGGKNCHKYHDGGLKWNAKDHDRVANGRKAGVHVAHGCHDTTTTL